ncbi:MAG: hypothetical protein ACLP9L_09125 [Thermoguttaceae bacterium]
MLLSRKREEELSILPENDTRLFVDIDTSTDQRSINDHPVPTQSRYNPVRDPVALIQEAMSVGVPLHEIEEYLDWLDGTREPPSKVQLGSSRGTPMPRAFRIQEGY